MDEQAAITEFLRGIGIRVESPQLSPEDCFLPGIQVERGGLLVDEAQLEWPGDLLHEAGHIAVAPPGFRDQMTGGVDVPGLDMHALEFAAVPWSYAAALAIGIDPAIVFHEGGYHGHSPGLLRTFALGVPPGLRYLQEAGMAVSAQQAKELGVDPYPHMLRWLRE